MSDEKFAFAALLNGTLGLLRENPLPAILAVALTAASGVVSDLSLIGSAGLLLASVVALATQYWLMRSVLEGLNLLHATKPRFWAFFLLGIVAGLAIIAGLVLLIVPAIILFVRWSITVPTVIGTDLGVMDSIGESWRETEGGFWPILGLFAVLYLPGIAVAIVGVLLEPLSGTGLIATLLFNLGFNVAIVAGWLGSLAIYAAVHSRTNLSEVFA